MTRKIVIAKTGYNALTETDSDNLAYSSAYNTLKYYVSGSLTINVNVGSSTSYSYTNSVNHNLSLFPFHIIYVKYSTNWEMIGTNYSTGIWPTTYIYRKFEGWVTKTKLYVKVRGNTGTDVTDTYSTDFRYKIFKNNLNL